MTTQTDKRQQKSRVPLAVGMIVGIAVICIAFNLFIEIRSRKLRALDIRCGSRVKDIAFVATMWANDNGTNLPADFAVLRDRFKKPDIFQCPASGEKYELQRPGFTVRCRFHGHSNTAYQP